MELWGKIKILIKDPKAHLNKQRDVFHIYEWVNLALHRC